MKKQLIGTYCIQLVNVVSLESIENSESPKEHNTPCMLIFFVKFGRSPNFVVLLYCTLKSVRQHVKNCSGKNTFLVVKCLVFV